MSYRYRYPALSPSGYLASGARDLDVVGVRRGTGWGPVWLDDDRLVVNGGTTTRLVYRDVSRPDETAAVIAYQELSAHAGQWVGCTPGSRLRLPDGQVFSGRYFAPCYYAGTLAVLVDTGTASELRLDGRVLVRGNLTQPSLSRTQILWRQGFGKGWRTLIARHDGSNPRDITVGASGVAVEHWSILVETPTGDLVLSHNGSRTYLRRPGETTGWHVVFGECFEPRAIWTPEGVVVAWMANGTRERQVVPIFSSLAVDLTPTVSPILTIPEAPAPSPSPLPTPTESPMSLTLRTHTGQYICAGGGGAVVADRLSVGPWESFTQVPGAEGRGIALRTWDGVHYLCAEEGGGREVIANRTAVGVWETFNVGGGQGTSARPPSSIDRARFLDAAGAPVVLRYCSAFTLAGYYGRGNRDQAEQYLDWVQAQGFTGVRVLCGALTWAQQTLSAAQAGLPALLDALRARGLSVELTALTDTGVGGILERHAVAHLRLLGDLARATPGGLIEVANEIGHPSQARWLTADWCRQQGESSLQGCLWAVGAPLGQDEQVDGRFPSTGGRYLTAHLDRGRPFWEQVRRVRELYGLIETFTVPVVNNEPIGAFSVTQPGRRESNPTFFRALGALNSLFGVQGVFHLDAGLRCPLPSPQETACAQAFLQGHSVLGDAAGSLSYRNVGHAGSPLTGISNVVRAYSFIDENRNRGITIALGHSSASRYDWANGWTRDTALIDDGGLQVWALRRG